MQQKQNDRVSYSFGMKLSLPAKYESADFHVSLTSDVHPNEANDQAMNRVKREVEEYAAKIYQQIRNSEEGLTGEPAQIQQSKDKPDDSGNSTATRRNELLTGHTAVETVPGQNSTGNLPDAKQPGLDIPHSTNRPRDIKALRQQIKFAAGVLESQKKLSKIDFKSTYLGGKKTDELNELEVTKAIVSLREKYPELGL